LGRERVAIDTDGDGQLDATLVPCPNGTPRSNATPPSTESGVTLVPIDENCDGTIDGYARLRSLTPIDPGDAPLDSLSDGLNDGSGGNGGAAGRAAPQSGGDRLTGGSTNWGRLLLVIGGGIAALLLAFFALRMLLGDTDAVTDTDPEPPRDAVDDTDASVQASLTILRMSTDPRDGIIRAYSQLLDGLAHAGLPRLSYEAPEEYVRRCCTSLQIRPEPMMQLTELFGVARFSTHELRETHHRAALDALQAVAADLATVRSAHSESQAESTGSFV
jgi:Domain of unknown function (DUF4129)